MLLTDKTQIQRQRITQRVDTRKCSKKGSRVECCSIHNIGQIQPHGYHLWKMVNAPADSRPIHHTGEHSSVVEIAISLNT